MRRNTFQAYPYALWLAIFTIIPMIIVVWFAFTNADGGFTLENFSGMAAYAVVFWRSFRLAIISTAACLVLGYPMAYAMSRLTKKGQTIAMMLIMLPMWMNFLLRTMAWQTLLERNGVINGILAWLHLPKQNLINTPAAIVLGMVYNFLPFMVLPIYNVLAKIDDNTINAAKDLGANTLQTLFFIWLPLSLPGIISGITMVFVPSLTTFVISDLLGGSKILLIGNVIEQEFTKGNNWHLGSGLSLVLMVFILISMAMIAKYDKNGEGTAF